jgi:hypothetical protein
MKVNLRCFSKLANQDRCGFNANTSYNLDKGHTVEDLVQRIWSNGPELPVRTSRSPS